MTNLIPCVISVPV